MVNKGSRAIQIIKNVLLRLLSAFLSTGIRQFITLPVLAATFPKEVYGTILTIQGVANITELALGNTLNNTRLVTNAAYEEKSYTGDFNCLVLITIILGMIITPIIAHAFPSVDLVTGILLWLVIVFGTMNAYYIVGLTMRLQFNRVLIQSILVGVGTLIGVGLTKLTGLWPFSFLVGSIFGVAYLFFTTPLMREKLKWTPLARTTTTKWATLIGVSLVANIVTYLDRLLIYPFVGAAAVAIYTTASFFGKCASALIPPVSNVLLAYFSQSDYKMDRKVYFRIAGMSVLFCLCSFIASLPIAPFITRLLYPSLMEEARPFMVLANAAAMLSAASILIQAIVLKYSRTTNLLFIQIIYGVVYIGGGLLMIGKAGIRGFCWAAIAANMVQLICLILFGYFGVTGQGKKISG